MHDWTSVQLKDAGTWLSGGTPFTGNPRYWDGDIPWISATSLKDFRISRSQRCVTELGAVSGTRLVPPRTVLFVVRGMSLKTEFRVGVTERQVAFGQDCKAIIPACGIDARFLALALKARSRDILAMVDEAGHGTGRLPTDLIAKLRIDVPALPEQRRITEILDSADDQIRLSMNSIAKQKELRIAAIRQLAAYGLGCFQGLEASELRRASERSAGSWSPVPLGSLLTGIDAGHSPDLEDTPARPGQWGVLKVSAVGEDGFRPEENKVAHYKGLHDSAICAHAGDLLMTRANTSQLVGRSCIVRDIPAGLMLSDKILRLRVAERPASTRYVHIVLGLAEVRRQIEIAATGTSNSMKNISQSSVRQLIVPIGSREDVNRIVEIDKLHEDRITALRDEAEALRSLKHGLMDDLLTGRVRVAALYLGVEFAVGGDVIGWGKASSKWSLNSSGVPKVSP